MDNETINEMEQTTKELDLSAEEIQGYIACSNRTQYCLTDCPWPFGLVEVRSGPDVQIGRPTWV